MTDIKLFLKRSAIAAVSLALIVPGLAFFSLADDEQQQSSGESVTITSTDGMVETYVPIPTTASEVADGFRISGKDGETSVAFDSSSGYETHVAAEATPDDGTAPSVPDNTIDENVQGDPDFHFGANYTTDAITTRIANTTQGDSTLVTYTVTNGSGADKVIYVGSGVWLQSHNVMVTSSDCTDGFTVVSRNNDEAYKLEIKPGDANSQFDVAFRGTDGPRMHLYGESVTDNIIGTGVASNLGYSWKVTVPAGESISKSALFTMLKKVLVPISTPSGSSDSSDSSSGSDDIPIEIVEDPNVTDIQVQLVSTQAGGALPNEELGTATVPTKTLKLDLSTMSNAQFVSSVQDGIKDIPQGGAFVLDVDQVGCFNTGIIEILEQRRDIEVTVIFVNEGQRTKVVIPAGYDVRQLLDENGYCGFLRLAGLLGSTPV
jgi:hypothetical protein